MNTGNIKNARPRISVVIPCYNHGRFVDEAVDSVLNQTFQDFEIIIVNDGSTDPVTNELLRNYHRPHITVYTIENSGTPGARNYGIERSRGEYIFPLDADDKIAPECLEKCLSVLDRNPKFGFVYAYVKFFGGEEEGEWFTEQFNGPRLLLGNMVCGSSLIRRKAFDDVGGYNIEMREGREDWDFWIGMVEKGWQGYRIPEHLFLYRKRAGTMSSKSNMPHNRVRLLGRIVKNHSEIFSGNLPYIVSEREKTILKQNAYTKHLEREYKILSGALSFGIYRKVIDSVLGLLRPLRKVKGGVRSFLRAGAAAGEPSGVNAEEWKLNIIRQHKEPARFKPKVAFIVPALGIGGGLATVCQHCNRLLRRGFDMSIVYNNLLEFHALDWFPDQQVEVRSIENIEDNYDVAVATGWSTAYNLLHFPACRKYYFVKSDETRFFPDDTELVEEIRKTYTFDFNYITEGKWIQQWLLDNFGKKTALVPNGIDLELFHPAEPLEPKGNRLRVLLEGPIDLPFKNMRDAFEVVRDLDCEVWCVSSSGKLKAGWRCDRFFEYVPIDRMKNVYASCDILLKLSTVEGVFSPPLEMMACGGTNVAGRVSGWDQYIVEGYNALTVELGDIEAAKAAVSRLIEDAELRNKLIKGGRETAEKMDWEPSIDKLEELFCRQEVQS